MSNVKCATVCGCAMCDLCVQPVPLKWRVCLALFGHHPLWAARVSCLVSAESAVLRQGRGGRRSAGSGGARPLGRCFWAQLVNVDLHVCGVVGCAWIRNGRIGRADL